MNRFLLLTICMSLSLVSLAQLAVWNDTCDGDGASMTDANITAGTVSISETGCGTDCCGNACFSGQEGAVRVLQSFNTTGVGTFEFPLTFDADGTITSLNIDFQRSGTGYSDFEVFIDGSSYFSDSQTGGSSTWTENITISPALNVSSGTTISITIEASNGGSSASSCGSAGTFRVEVMEVIGTAAPVELSSFTATDKEGMAVLNWTTASEINNSHFDVLRSIDGRSFETIGVVKGMGTTNVAQSYSFASEIAEGMSNYYRLKQVDYDGAFELSNVLVLKSKDSRDTNFDVFLIGASEINVLGAVDSEYIIRDQQGRTLLSGHLTGYDNIDIGTLNQGVYFISVMDHSGIETKRFYK